MHGQRYVIETRESDNGKLLFDIPNCPIPLGRNHCSVCHKGFTSHDIIDWYLRKNPGKAYDWETVLAWYASQYWFIRVKTW